MTGRRMLFALATLLLALAGGRAQEEVPALPSSPMSVRSLLDLEQPEPDERVAYGEERLHFGQLWLPSGDGPHPVALVLHGGCWQSAFDLRHLGRFCQALQAAGVACWSIEYRRIGDVGGGWPGTFEDVAAGADHLRPLAEEHWLDLERVVAVGHSAGAHLALWLAARPRLPEAEPLRGQSPLALAGVVSLAGVADLRRGLEERVCGSSIAALLGGPPERHPERYRLASPIEHLPLGVPQWIIAGSKDGIVPFAPQEEYTRRARKAGDIVALTKVDGAGHFELVVPGAVGWVPVRDAILAALHVDPVKEADKEEGGTVR